MLAEQGAASRWLLVSLVSGRVHAMIDWPPDAAVRVRACGGEWLMFDQQGRLLRFDTVSGTYKGIGLR
jgi:hypothetical protein